MAKQKKEVVKPASPQAKTKKAIVKPAVLTGKEAETPASKPEPTGRPQLAATDLVALTNDASKQAVVNITFTSGRGQTTAILFRNGILINMQSISTSSDIHFSDVQTGDAISINGVCTGTATINIDIKTDPATPSNFEAGSIHMGYDIV